MDLKFSEISGRLIYEGILKILEHIFSLIVSSMESNIHTSLSLYLYIYQRTERDIESELIMVNARSTNSKAVDLGTDLGSPSTLYLHSIEQVVVKSPKLKG